MTRSGCLKKLRRLIVPVAGREAYLRKTGDGRIEVGYKVCHGRSDWCADYFPLATVDTYDEAHQAVERFLDARSRVEGRPRSTPADMGRRAPGSASVRDC